jgi:hypothetical protein
MSQDTQLFQPPKSYPEAPKDMYYQVPSTRPTAQKMNPIFPWEAHAPKPTRVFLDESTNTDRVPRGSSPSLGIDDSRPPGETPLTPTVTRSSVDPWQTYSRSNAWDEVPEIERYIHAIQQSRKAKVQVLPTEDKDAPSPDSTPNRRPSLRLTDFPSEFERPSLPVTPAPIRRTNFWSKERDEPSDLPTAEGVPEQDEWVGLTVAAFLNLLQTAYLYWQITEPRGPAGGASTSTVRDPRKRSPGR